MTTRTLVLVRHAKAANPPALADIDRPLTDRGHADAAAAGGWLARRGFLPDLVLCSTARRTRETWRGVSVPLGGSPTVRFDEEIYVASLDGLLELVQAAHDDVSTLLMVGHNPGLSQLCALLDPSADPDGLRTAGAAVHRFTGTWPTCTPGTAPQIAHHTARA